MEARECRAGDVSDVSDLAASAAGLALVPIPLGGIKPRQEIERLLVVVILGGLVTSMLLNVFLLPPQYARFGQRVVDHDDSRKRLP